MIHLTKARDAWGTAAFDRVLKDEIEDLDADALPLQQGLASGSHANKGFRVMIISVAEGAGFIRAKAGVFYTSIIAGCSCADDPTPVDEIAEYCEVEFAISRRTGAASVTLLSD
jgi:hypothetical protein